MLHPGIKQIGRQGQDGSAGRLVQIGVAVALGPIDVVRVIVREHFLDSDGVVFYEGNHEKIANRLIGREKRWPSMPNRQKHQGGQNEGDCERTTNYCTPKSRLLRSVSLGMITTGRERLI